MLIVFWVRGAKIVKGESKAKIYFGPFLQPWQRENLFSLCRG